MLTKEIDFKKYNNDTVLKEKKQKVSLSKDFLKDLTENKQLLEEAEMYWSNLYDFRKRRQRARRYYRGDQWGDYIPNPDKKGEYIKEEDLIRATGRVPLKQNMIRPIVRNLKGQYRMNPLKGIVTSRIREKQTLAETMSAALEAEMQVQRAKDVHAQNIEELVLSGLCIGKLIYDYIPERDSHGLVLKNVNVNRAFFNSDLYDIRINPDLRLVGEFYDMPIDDIVFYFAKSKADQDSIRELYGEASLQYSRTKAASSQAIDNLSFLYPNDFSKGRVFEIWKKVLRWRFRVHDPVDATLVTIENITEGELKEINRQRVANAALQGVPEEKVPLLDWEFRPEFVWWFKFLSPTGHCLMEGETPYKHQSHPYSIAAAPLLDGEIWGLVEDIIDQQRYINRLISQDDFIRGNAAKGVLMVPEGAVPKNTSPEDFASEWTKPNGVLFYVPKPGVEAPHQVTSNSSLVGLGEQFALQMQLIMEISGVSKAIQGQSAKSGTPSSLYAQEAQNSTINIRDIFEIFASYKQELDTKGIQLIQQFKTEPYYISIAGRDVPQAARMYDPEQIKDVGFDYQVIQSMDAGIYRQIVDDQLWDMVKNRMITMKTFLENSSLPFADKLLDSITKDEQAIAAGQQSPTGLDNVAGQQSQVMQSLDPKTAATIQAAMSRTKAQPVQ